MKESSLWALLKANRCKWALKAMRIEDSCNRGTPDVFAVTINGKSVWIELKNVNDIPKKLDTKFVVNCFTIDQRKFAADMFSHNRSGFLLIRAKDSFILIDGLVAANHLNYVSLTQLKAVSLGLWEGNINWNEFRLALEGSYND